MSTRPTTTFLTTTGFSIRPTIQKILNLLWLKTSLQIRRLTMPLQIRRLKTSFNFRWLKTSLQILLLKTSMKFRRRKTSLQKTGTVESFVRIRKPITPNSAFWRIWSPSTTSFSGRQLSESKGKPRIRLIWLHSRNFSKVNIIIILSSLLQCTYSKSRKSPKSLKIIFFNYEFFFVNVNLIFGL